MSKPLQPGKLDPLPYRVDGKHLLAATEIPVFEAFGIPKTLKFIAVACNSYHDLLAACIAVEEAEDFRANDCPDCADEGTISPELCEYCFPYYDKARVLRRAAIAKAEGRTA